MLREYSKAFHSCIPSSPAPTALFLLLACSSSVTPSSSLASSSLAEFDLPLVLHEMCVLTGLLLVLLRAPCPALGRISWRCSSA